MNSSIMRICQRGLISCIPPQRIGQDPGQRNFMACCVRVGLWVRGVFLWVEKGAKLQAIARVMFWDGLASKKKKKSEKNKVGKTLYP